MIRGRRMHGGDAADALRLIAAVPDRDRCVWALAFFAGLRLGELRALRWSDVDEDKGVINVSRSWDDREGEIVTKSAAGERAIPIIASLRPHLAAQRERCPWWPDGLVLGNSAHEPFHYNGLYRRSEAAWKAAGLERVTPHQARHSFASLLIASGAEVKTVTDIMGHTPSANRSIATDTSSTMRERPPPRDSSRCSQPRTRRRGSTSSRSNKSSVEACERLRREAQRSSSATRTNMSRGLARDTRSSGSTNRRKVSLETPSGRGLADCQRHPRNVVSVFASGRRRAACSVPLRRNSGSRRGTLRIVRLDRILRRISLDDAQLRLAAVLHDLCSVYVS